MNKEKDNLLGEEARNRKYKRMKRFELSTLSLARRCSTTELHPQFEARAYALDDPSSMQHRGALGQAVGRV